MEKGKYIRIQTEKKTREKASEIFFMGTIIWGGMLVSGFAGIAYLTVWIVRIISHGDFTLMNLVYGTLLLALSVQIFRSILKKRRNVRKDIKE